MPYAGDVTALECWTSLKEESNAQLVDVRTVQEWQLVGVPELADLGKEAVFVEWQQFPHMGVHAGFVQEVTAELAVRECDKNDSVYVICRSGVRSMAAAEVLTAAGYTKVFNVLSGFEGDPDETGQRGRVSGWKFDGLSWRQ